MLALKVEEDFDKQKRENERHFSTKPQSPESVVPHNWGTN
jgi:hypothetical protein